MEDREWKEEDIVLISALEHYSYCPRQCALIHMERTYDENIYTMRGNLLHERADSGEAETRADIRTERAVPLWSDRLGLAGKADVIEFHEETPFPVEYKVGPKREWGHDDVQLCAQAICLEEMTGKQVKKGAVYHNKSRRRREVEFKNDLRQKVETMTREIRDMLIKNLVPLPKADKRCDKCSLKQACLPHMIADTGRFAEMRQELFKTESKE